MEFQIHEQFTAKNVLFQIKKKKLKLEKKLVLMRFFTTINYNEDYQ